MANKVPSMKELMKLYKKANYSNELNESSSREERKIALSAAKRIAKYRQVDLKVAIRDLVNAAQDLEKSNGKVN